MTTNQKEKIILAVQKRNVVGKANRMLRKQGMIPAVVYGQGTEPLSISIGMKDFISTYKKAGETSVIYISIEKQEIPTLITDYQIDPIRNSILHVDFIKVNLHKKIEASVPVEFVGESEAVKTLNGVLLTQTDEITVEALPTDIPHAFTIDLSKLTQIGDIVTVADLPKSSSYTIQDEEDKIIVSVVEHKEEELEPDTTSETPEVTAEGQEGEEAQEGAEGETPQAAEQPSDEGKDNNKKKE
ncbi:50S ribosomal protein L25 [Candidatus Woesebacteria bacterium]|nr:50S ribosomal protein L25 [Candidatus Woesebacteria bacterium]